MKIEKGMMFETQGTKQWRIGEAIKLRSGIWDRCRSKYRLESFHFEVTEPNVSDINGEDCILGDCHHTTGSFKVVFIADTLMFHINEGFLVLVDSPPKEVEKPKEKPPRERYISIISGQYV